MTHEEVAEMRQLLDNLRYHEFAEGEAYRREYNERMKAQAEWSSFCERFSREEIEMEVHRYDAGFQ